MAASLVNAARFASTSAAGAISAGKHKVVVVGGGSAGLAVANQLYNAFKYDGKELGRGDIAIVDSATEHHFQPGWTLVGAGLKDKRSFVKPLDSLIPAHIAHIPASAKSFSPSSNSLQLDNGETVKYDYLIVAAGLQINYDKVKGLKEAMGLDDPSEINFNKAIAKNRVSTIYNYRTCDKTWDLIESLQEGKALFTQPFGPVKCAGAPQKINYMAWDRWRRTGRGDKIQSEFITGMPTMFSVPYYSKALDALRQERGIGASFNTDLVEIRADDKVAVFKETTGDKKTVEKSYDMIHVTPPMGPLDVIKNSPLADSAGWVDVSASSLQHNKFPNVFSLGDCSSLPTSKTAAAITAQTPVLVENLSKLMETGQVGEASYDGYTSCPLFTSYDGLMLAEFVYGAQPKESFGKFVDQRNPKRAFYHLAKDVFPFVYFNNMVKGTWYGPNGIVPPQYVPKVVPS